MQRPEKRRATDRGDSEVGEMRLVTLYSYAFGSIGVGTPTFQL